MLPAHFHLRAYLVKNTAGAHKDPSKKYKNNLRTLKIKSYEKCRTTHEYYNNKATNFFNSWTTEFPNLIKVLKCLLPQGI